MASGASGKPQTGKHTVAWEVLGDFTVTLRVLTISGLAIAIGALAALVALALLRLIGLFTNFYFGCLSTLLVSPSGTHLGVVSLLVPIGGAIIIGLMGAVRIGAHSGP
jgi:chloride channel protein, CIC family